jgi:Glycine cleavage system T protein (aminomethyltransferase)
MYKNVYKNDDMKRSEHMAVRNTVGWYLWTHQLLEVTGEDAAAFLDMIFPKNIANLKVGAERYTTMLDENAEIIDDVVVLRMEEKKYWVSTLFIHYMIPWFDAHKGNYQVEYVNVTKNWDMYAVQGPKSLDTINALVKEHVDELKFFNIRDNEIDGIPVKINRAGFTGEKLGYEIYVSPEKSDEVEEKLRATAAKFGGKEVTEFQVLAWTLPTEAGFYYMRDLRHTNPFEVGLDGGINFDKEFIGKKALLKIKTEGAAREILGFTLADDDYAILSAHLCDPGEPVLFNGEQLGRVHKLIYGYVKEQNIGYIFAKKGILNIGDHVSLHGHDAIITKPSFL